VGVNGSDNAGILAVQILSLSEPELQQKLLDYKKEMAESVAKKDAALQEALKEN
jgi:5-(carboxyamino)imidazole ribonucleotide mutase